MSTSPISSRPPGCTRTVLISLDASQHSSYAFKWSLDNIIRTNGEDFVLVVTCVPGGDKWADITNAPITAGKKEDIERAERSRSETLLSAYKAELSKRLVPNRGMILKGDAKNALVGVAEEADVALMIMGSRGMGSVKKAIIGSVSDYCVNHAPCPVLIVRKPSN